MCDNGVRYIHTQEQAKAELERQRQMAKARRARRLERTAAGHETARITKQNRIQNDLFHIDNITDAHKIAKIRLAQKERDLECSAEERDDVLNKIHERYYAPHVFSLMSFRLKELDAEFCDLQIREQQWPEPLPDVKPMYKKCVTQIHTLARNIVCASCGCIHHDISEFKTVPDSFEHLRRLQIPLDVDIPFDFSCGIDHLDQNRILIDKLGITIDNQIRLYRYCYN